MKNLLVDRKFIKYLFYDFSKHFLGENIEKSVMIKALPNWKIYVKALSKQLQKLTIITKRLITVTLLIVSLVNIND